MKDFGDCAHLETFNVFEVDDEDAEDLNAIGVDGTSPANVWQIVGLWEPTRERSEDERQLFINAAKQLLDNCGDEWYDTPSSYVSGQLLTRVGWERLYIVSLQTEGLRH